MYLSRYPELSPDRCLVIANGYDEADFKVFDGAPASEPPCGRPLRLLHAGLVYPEERNPRPFFAAVARLKAEGQIDNACLKVDLRASGSEAYYQGLLRELKIEDIVHLLPPIPYREALHDCFNADALIVFQSAWCNHQIPAKVYEYLRLKRPILALTPHAGDTAALLREVGGATIIDLADEKAIYSQLPSFLRKVRSGTHLMPNEDKIHAFSRKNQAQQLANCLNVLLPQNGCAEMEQAQS